MEQSQRDRDYEWDVAISVSGKDRWRAVPLVRALQKAGVRVFYDDTPGSELHGSLPPSLRKVYYEQARFCVPLISHNYVNKNSRWTAHELDTMTQRAEDSGNWDFLVPIVLDRKHYPDSLPDEHAWIDLTKGPAACIASLAARIGLPNVGRETAASWLQKSGVWGLDLQGQRLIRELVWLSYVVLVLLVLSPQGLVTWQASDGGTFAPHLASLAYLFFGGIACATAIIRLREVTGFAGLVKPVVVPIFALGYVVLAQILFWYSIILSVWVAMCVAIATVGLFSSDPRGLGFVSHRPLRAFVLAVAVYASLTALCMFIIFLMPDAVWAARLSHATKVTTAFVLSLLGLAIWFAPPINDYLRYQTLSADTVTDTA